MTLWFTSDTHFGHAAIIKHCKRPWIDSMSMDADLIKIWNKLISPDDVVYHLGDFSCNRKDWREDEDILSQLNGEKHLILGNHDNYDNAKKCSWVRVYDDLTLKLQHNDQYIKMILTHFPLREWDSFYYGAYHLYGHVHNTMPDYCRSMDVGIDTNQYMPYTLDQVIGKLKPFINKHLDRKIL